MADNKNRSRVKSVGTTLDILQYLHEHPESTLEEIAKALDTSTSTAHRHLMTVQERGCVIAEDNRYRLSLKFLTYAGRTRNEILGNGMIEQKIHQLSQKTSERTQFIVEENGERIYAYTFAGPNAVKTDATIGKRGPLHVSAAGKAILAKLPDDTVNEILSESIPKEMPTGPSHDEIVEELQTIRQRGYAFNDEESTPGLRAVGVPVMCPQGTVLGAISVSGPADRLTNEYFREELPNLLLGTVNEIELNLKYS